MGGEQKEKVGSSRISILRTIKQIMELSEPLKELELTKETRRWYLTVGPAWASSFYYGPKKAFSIGYFYINKRNGVYKSNRSCYYTNHYYSFATETRNLQKWSIVLSASNQK